MNKPLKDRLPRRAGPKPKTTPTNPHTQLDQIAPVKMQQALAARIFAFDCVEEQPSPISVPGARALMLCTDCQAGPRDAFMMGREFAHLHPPYDGSLHAALPPDLAKEAIEMGWAEIHPIAAQMGTHNIVMIFGPRDEDELETVYGLIRASRNYAHAESGAGRTQGG